MWTVKELWLVFFLGIASVWDLVKREVPVWYLTVGTLVAIVWQIFGYKGEELLLLFGGLTGIFFFFMSRCTGQAFGYGDSWMILILGITLGIWRLLVALGIAFLGAALIAGIGIASKRLTRKSRIPFFPFLFIGYLGVWGW